MSDEARIQELRTAFVMGWRNGVATRDWVTIIDDEKAMHFAKIRYPLPRVPRVVTTDDGFSWRLVDGVLECRGTSITTWQPSAWRLADMKQLLDLIAHPLEDACD